MTAPKITRDELSEGLYALGRAFGKPLSWAEGLLDLAEDHLSCVQPGRYKKIVAEIIRSAEDQPRNIIAAILRRHRTMPYNPQYQDHTDCEACVGGFITLRMCRIDRATGRVTSIKSSSVCRCSCPAGMRLDRSIPRYDQVTTDSRLIKRHGAVYYGDEMKPEAAFIVSSTRHDGERCVGVLPDMPRVGDILEYEPPVIPQLLAPKPTLQQELIPEPEDAIPF